MKQVTFIVGVFIAAMGAQATASERIYRCGNEYTNTVSDPQAKHCKLVSGGNVTVVQAPKGNAAFKVATATPRLEGADQRSKDSDARLILEAELKKAENRQAELLKEYNGGDPERLGAEARNNQKYLDRIAELKANIARNDSDIAGIRRELGRLPGASTSGSSTNTASSAGR